MKKLTIAAIATVLIAILFASLMGCEDNGNETGGITWTEQESGITTALYDVVYGNNQFVAVGIGGVILTSPNGTTWTSRSTGMAQQELYDITYGNNQFVVVGANYQNNSLRDHILLASSDGSTWTEQQTTSEIIGAITYGNNQFVAMGTRTAFTSSNGTTWSSHTIGTSSQSQYLSDIIYVNNQFIAIGSEYPQNIILTSADGTTWTRRNIEQSLYDITYGNNQFVALGYSGMIFTSPDTTTWSSHTIGEKQYPSDLIYASNQFVATGIEGDLSGDTKIQQIILTSTNGSAWNKTWNSEDTQEYLSAIAYGNNQFVAVGSGGTILTAK